MAEQPQQGGFDVRKAIEASASRSTLQELAKRGIHRVKVLDEQMITKLIRDAVGQVVASKSDVLSDAEREKLIADSRKELDKLIKEFQSSKDKNELLAKDKDSLASEVENLQKQLQMQRQLGDTLGKQRFEDGRNAAKEEIESLKKKLADASAEAEKRVRAQLEGEFQKKMSAEMEKMSVLSRQMEVAAKSGGEEAVKNAVARRESELRAEFKERENQIRAEAGEKMAAVKEAEFSQKLMGEMQKNVELSQKLTSTLEEMRQRDDEIAKKMEQLFTKSIEGLSKKLSDIQRHGVAVGGGGGDIDESMFRQSADVIKHMLANELESNVKNMEQAEGKVAGKLGNALERLKAMRGGKPPDKDTKKE